MKTKNESVEKLEVGKDYVNLHDNDVIVIDIDGDIINRGFERGKYKNRLGCSSTLSWREATEEEVIEAFEKHLNHRFGEDWRTMKIKEKHPNSSIEINDGSWEVEICKCYDGWNVWNKNGMLYHNGIWVERLEKVEEGANKIHIKDAIKANTVIHCETEEESERILGMAHELGYKWCTGDGYKNNTIWENYKEETCYNIFDGNYAYVDFYEDSKQIIPSTQIADFEEKKTKVSKTQKPANCGYSVLATVPYQKCPVCEGVGQIFVNQLDPYNTNSSIGYKPCHVCGGSGIIPMHVLPCNEV